jgi:hypothetical protein
VISPRGDGLRQARLERIGKPAEPGAMMKIPMRIAGEIDQLVDTYDEKRATAPFARLKQNGTWLLPTLSVLQAYA